VVGFSVSDFESPGFIATETGVYLCLLTYLFNQVVCGMQVCLCLAKMLTGI
jgi:hypothetical protein